MKLNPESRRVQDLREITPERKRYVVDQVWVVVDLENGDTDYGPFTFADAVVRANELNERHGYRQ